MSSNLPEHKLELESQFIMRLPASKAESLRHAIKSGEPLSNKLSIKFEPDIRSASVRYDGTELAARLFDLPTIIESYKTLDKKNFYKTADISQILICKEKSEDNGSNENDKQNNDTLFMSIGGAGKREFLYPHGITPPLKNVRKRRFRKTLKKKYVDYSEIEKEVKRLLKFDCEAIDSRYELVEENKLNKNQETSQLEDELNPPSPMSGGQPPLISAENSQNMNLLDLFGDECSSSDESSDEDDDEDDDKDDDELEMDHDRDDNNDDNDQDEDMEEVEPYQQEPAADIAAELAAASDLIAENDDNEEKRQELERELTKIKDRIQTQEIEMDGLDNQALRQRLQLVLDSLHEQENEIVKKLEDLS